jgi:hypothetical protein
MESVIEEIVARAFSAEVCRVGQLWSGGLVVVGQIVVKWVGL